MTEHLRKIGTVKVVDMNTGEVISEKRNAFSMLPMRDGVCQECGVDHAHDQPHNRDSLPYQYRFRGTHGRWPTWTDAMAHCTPEVKAAWRTAMIETCRERGLEVPADLLEQKPAGR